MLFNIQTQMDLLTSRQMAERVVDKMDLVHRSVIGSALPPSATEQEVAARKKSLVGFVAGGLTVKPRRGSRLIDLTFESPNSSLSAEIVNTVCDEFINYDLETRTKTTKQAATWLNSELDGMKNRVEDSQRKLVEYTKANPVMGIVSTGDKDTVSVTIDRLAGLSKQLLDAENERISIEAKYRFAKDSGIEAITAGEVDPSRQALLAKASDLREKLRQLLLEYQDDAPAVVSAKEQLAQVQKDIDGAKSTNREEMLAKLGAQYNAAVLKEKTLRDSFDKQRGMAMEESGLSIQYAILKQDADANQKLYNNILQRLKEATLTVGLQDASARVVNYAQTPMFRSYPPVTRNLAMGGILGIGFGVGLVFLLDYLDNTLKTTEDVNRILQLPALGVIPALGTLNKRRLLGPGGSVATSAELISDHPADSGYAEAYRSLRTSVLLSLADHTPKTILVTSPQPSEGKTTTAVNIAIALAQTGAKVLVIDADMRRPRCHKALGVPNRKGLSTFLSSGVDFDELIAETASGVNILPCGPTPPNPSELLTSPRMLSGLRELEGRYDHIVIDSPPVATVSDALILAKSVDGVVLVVQGGSTSRNIAMRARHMLLNVGAKVFGVVLNKVDAGSSYYYDYYYKYGYYYSRDTSEGEDQASS